MRLRAVVAAIPATIAAVWAVTHVVDWAQFLNGLAAVVAVAAAQVAFIRLAVKSRAYIAVHFVQVTLLIWYAAINLLLALDLLVIETLRLVPLFRWAFAPLLATYALRQMMSARRIVEL